MTNMHNGIKVNTDIPEIFLGLASKALYDIKRDAVTMADGVATHTWTVRETRPIEIQPVRFSAERSAAIMTVDLGGQSFVPSFRGWMELDSDITAADMITADSGTIDLLVLRTYDMENHKEIDLREAPD